MAVISTGLLTAGVKSDFYARLATVPVYYKELSTRLASTTGTENYRWLGTVPQMRAWGGGRRAKGIRSESYDVKNEKYEATIEVDRDEMSDDQTGQIRLRVQELAERAATHKDFLIEELLKNGETAGFNSYDGLPFFSTVHVSGASGNQSNKLTYNANDPDEPTLDEFRAAFKVAIAAMIAWKDDVGEPMRLDPNPAGFVTIVPASMYFTALDALSIMLVPTSGNPGGVNTVMNAAKVICLPGLTDASMWYLCKTDRTIRPFVFQDREPIEFKSVAEGSEEEFKREKYYYGVRARYAMTYGEPALCISTDFTATEPG